MYNERDLSIAEFKPLILLLSYRSTIFISACIHFCVPFLAKGITASLLIQANVEYKFSSSRQSSKKTV